MRLSADNRRVVLVLITAAGLALLDALTEPVRDCARRQLGHLDEKQKRLLIELLRAARAPTVCKNGQESRRWHSCLSEWASRQWAYC